MGRNADPFLGPESGPIFGSGFLPPILIHTNSQRAGPFLGPDSGPKNGAASAPCPAPKRGRLRALLQGVGGAPMVESCVATGLHWEDDLAHGCGQSIHLLLAKRQQRRSLHEQVKAAPELYFVIPWRDIPSISRVSRFCGTFPRQRCCMTVYFGSRQLVGAWA